jgi:hypothetical protein
MAPDWLVSLQREDGFQAASLGFAQGYVDMSMRLRLAVRAAGRRGSVYRGGDGRMQMLDTAWAPSRGVLWCSNERPRADCRGCRKVQALTGSPPNQPLGLVPRPPATRRHPRRYHQNIAWETSAASNRARRGSSALSTRVCIYMLPVMACSWASTVCARASPCNRSLPSATARRLVAQPAIGPPGTASSMCI